MSPDSFLQKLVEIIRLVKVPIMIEGTLDGANARVCDLSKANTSNIVRSIIDSILDTNTSLNCSFNTVTVSAIVDNTSPFTQFGVDCLS